LAYRLNCENNKNNFLNYVSLERSQMLIVKYGFMLMQFTPFSSCYRNNRHDSFTSPVCCISKNAKKRLIWISSNIIPCMYRKGAKHGASTTSYRSAFAKCPALKTNCRLHSPTKLSTRALARGETSAFIIYESCPVNSIGYLVILGDHIVLLLVFYCCTHLGWWMTRAPHEKTFKNRILGSSKLLQLFALLLHYNLINVKHFMWLHWSSLF
jgi:hypothetical protein